MAEYNRWIYLIILSVISLLSIHQFFDILLRFNFLFNDILRNITKSVIIFMMFSFFIAVTGFVSVLFNWSLIRSNHKISNLDSNWIDDFEVNKSVLTDCKFKVYHIFSNLLIGLGIFMFLQPLQESYPIKNLPNGILAYLFILGILSIGIASFRDVSNIKIFYKG